MNKNRLEAFSDGVIVIIITIMVLELKVPHGDTFQALTPLIPVFLTYVLSFIYIGIYWNNHHHMLHTCDKVTGPPWGEFTPLVLAVFNSHYHGLDGRKSFCRAPSALYGVVLLMAGICLPDLAAGYYRVAGKRFPVRAIRQDWKGKNVPGRVPGGGLCGVLVPLAIPGYLCPGRPYLADPGPAD